MHKSKQFTSDELGVLSKASIQICEALLIEPNSEQALEVRRHLFRDCSGQEPVDAIVERYLSTRVRA
ncbi:hypothetical protein ACRQ1B_15530 [Rhizobium panacihumi]|uniref:hypothetical protein n=1 Tax=Rhizobium panacihumi TaxID=2008450 RepID=UPI003D78B5BE